MSKIRRLFSKENIVGVLGRLGKLRIKITHVTLLELSVLILVLILAFTIRLLPMRWGYYLSEFDPYYQYRLTKDMVENGFLHWTTWQDQRSWWPWGRDMAYTSFPGLALTAASLYTVLNALGVPMAPTITENTLANDPIYNFVVVFPVILATLTCLALYFLGKDIGGKEVGLFAAFFLALNASYIGRTSLGFFDDETVGIFALILFSLFFLRSIDQEKSTRATSIYAIVAGLSLGYLFISWGAARYPVGLTLVFVLVLLVLRRYSSRLLTSYGVTFGLALLIAMNLEHLGGIRFLKEGTNIAVYGVFLLLCAFEISRRIETTKMKRLFAVAVVVLGIALFVGVYLYGNVGTLEPRYWSILNPFERLASPAVASVQEHRPASWGSIYYDFGIGILFVPVGFYFAASNPTNRNIYLILFGLTSIYFASTMVRLMLILAPALCLLWALALTRILKPFVTLLREKPVVFRGKRSFGTHVGREFSAAFLILLFLLLTFTFLFPSPESRASGGDQFPRVISQAYVPTTIAAASLPVKPDQTLPDWIDALNWMRYNLEPDAAIVSWWDYGYWITTIAGKISLADNGTINLTQIKRIGSMFMSSEADAIKVIDEFNQYGQSHESTNKVDYVVAFFTFDGSGNDVGYGEESKWRWMANIAGDNLDAHKQYGNYTLGRDWTDANQDGQPTSDELIDNPLGQSTLLYKMMQYGKTKRVTSVTATAPTYFDLIYWSQKDKSSVVNAGGINALVTVWKVKPH